MTTKLNNDGTPVPPLPSDYSERVYAGVLGKLIGVYLGRPFEQWTNERIERELGEIRYYVHEKLNVPLVVTDDDISGTFAFFRALADNGFSPDLTPAQIGETWLNNIIENKTILWWGGIGMSTEHTAWHRLASGVPAPHSGSIATNGRTVAEQIGAQIFIDAWGLLHPGDPAAAADWARRAASVSHDGEAVLGAQVVAAMIAAAFVESDIHRIIALALDQIPQDCLLRRMCDDVRSWHADCPRDWRTTLRHIQERYGYSRFPGACHVIPNHALIHLALLHSGGDFNEAQMIVNTAGWDTDCNAGNVGCILGVRNGLDVLGAGPDWRGPVADRMWIPTAEGGAAITDAVRETFHIVEAARALRKLPVLPAKPRFHFGLPGSVQGFIPDDAGEARGTLTLENVPAGPGKRALALHFRALAPGRFARAFTATSTPHQLLVPGSYAMAASPTLHSGQTIRARIVGSPDIPVAVGFAIRVYDDANALRIVKGPVQELPPGEAVEISWSVPPLDGFPVADIGIEVSCSKPASGTVVLEWLDWNGAPAEVSLAPEASLRIWEHAWVNAADDMRRASPTAIHIQQGLGMGMILQGSRDWKDYTFSTTLIPRLAKTAGLAVRAQGLRRYLAVLFCDNGRAKLVIRSGKEETRLKEADVVLTTEVPVHVELTILDRTVTASLDGGILFSVENLPPDVFDGGAAAILLEEGSLHVGNPIVRACL